MIKIKKLTKKNIGNWVKYVDSHGAVESGRIKSWNDRFIFVVYNWNLFKNCTAQATNPEDLFFIKKGKK